MKRGILELVVLRMLRDEPTYGYALIARLSELGPLAAGENTVYPLLRRLKKDGVLDTFSVQSPSGPPRQHYRLTTYGRALLTALEHQWQGVSAAVARVTGER